MVVATVRYENIKEKLCCYGLLRNNSYSQCFTPTTGRQSENSLMTECCSLSCVDERPRATHSLDSVLFVPVPILLVRFSFVHCVHLSTNCTDCTHFAPCEVSWSSNPKLGLTVSLSVRIKNSERFSIAIIALGKNYPFRTTRTALLEGCFQRKSESI